MAVERLLEIGLLKKEGAKVVKANGFVTTADPETTAPALKRRQNQILQKSMESLENDSIDIRNHSSITMAIDPAKIPEAKKRIREFGRSLCEYLESGARKEVYEFSLNLFPLSKTRRTEQ